MRISSVKIIANEYDCVLGIGGGSPMDAAKAATLIAGIPGNISDLHEYGKTDCRMKEVWKRPYMLVSMPTTSGTGAETTAGAVITSTMHGMKFSFGNSNISADIAVIDSEFTVGMPASVTNGSFVYLSRFIDTILFVFCRKKNAVYRQKCTPI